MATPSEAQRIYSGTIDSHGGAVFQGDLNAARDININHITTIRPFARSLYRSFMTSSESFKQVQNELGSLLAVLETTEDNSNEAHFDDDQQAHLCTLSQNCHQVLQDLQRLKARFDSMGTKTQPTWERMGWGIDDLADIRLRLISYTGMLNVFNSNIMNSSQARIEQMVTTLIDEVRTGKREGSVVSTQTTGSLSADQKEEWRQLRRELESVGITPVLFEQHRTFIVATLQKAIKEEGLAGDIPDTYDSFDCSDSGQEDLETLFTPEHVFSAYIIPKPVQQPIQDRNLFDKVPNFDIAGRIKNIMGRIARPWTEARFWAALKRCDVVLVERLLIEGATLDSRDELGETPLCWAAGAGHEKLVELLLENRAAVDLMDAFDETPLSWAARKGHEAVIKLLLDNGAAVDLTGKHFGTPLVAAVCYGHEAVVKLLLDNGAAVDLMDKRGRTPLSEAAAIGRKAMVRLLLDNGAAVDSMDQRDRTPLSWAAEKGHEAVVKLLLNNGAAVGSIDMDGESPLSEAAKEEHYAVVKLLLDNGAAVDSMDKWGLTPLVQAAISGNEAVVKLLLDNGAAVDLMDRGGNTPLSWAASFKRKAVVELLQLHAQQQ